MPISTVKQMQEVASEVKRQHAGRICTGCGKPQLEDAPQGLCPACLFRLVWDNEAEANPMGDEGIVPEPSASLDQQGSVPPGDFDSTLDAGRYVDWKPHDGGGIGEVFKATDRELHRMVALKRLRDERAGHSPSMRRFLIEAEITAGLDHPGVVPVHSLFHDESGRPCYTMRFINGPSLEDAVGECHSGSLDPVVFRRLLQSFIQVCQTVAYAHSRGVIHRDLKPKNVMLGKFGETIVVDWGLAKVVGRNGDEHFIDPESTLRPTSDSDAQLTAMGSAVGTPAYMSPEQAAGRWDIVGPPSDIYSLGALLYAILTGQPPISGENWPEIQQKIQRGDYPRPRVVNSLAPKALEAVCLKAMALKPEDRYESARDLAGDVELWLADEPVTAYREPLAERLQRWARRRKDLVAVAVSVIVVFITIAVGNRMIGLEKAKTDLEKRARFAEMSDFNREVVGDLTHRHAKLDQTIRTALDRMIVAVDHNSESNRPEFQSLKTSLLSDAADFWRQAASIDANPRSDPSPRTHLYRLHRALCLARLGEHELADSEARASVPWMRTSESSGEAAHLLARVYAILAARSPEASPMREKYASLAIEFLQQAVVADYVRENAVARLSGNADFETLRSREAFQSLLKEVKDE